ncbi:splicing regulatory glutamine/lysine-rich protein 1 [Pyrus x bretschneideri]|uniref:splicing regulatory glutamine/lysine-rich protein 1 n=1 Tax=Pyrus x bretschneideri TaxID=225117 RepID=UPI0020309388|nr:splicing regulatory glutamine/lysine-rich protein 1 [Pyrus x bretschneideri]
MEEEKAAAYYDELTRRGEGAARFKQGLGFSSANSDSENTPVRGSALAYSTSSSFLSKFVKASSPKKESELRNQAQIESIQNKLKRKRPDAAEEREEKQPARVSQRENKHSRKRSRSRSRERHSRRRSRRRRGRSRSRSWSPRDRRKERRRSRSSSPRERGSERTKGKSGKERKGGGADYSKLIEGYDKMSAAERVRAKMKLQLAETSEKDTAKGMGSGWERFEFNKDAPLDDEEVEAADDDAVLVKHIGQSFRFSAVETKREEQLRSAHDEAMFGASDDRPTIVMDSEIEEENDTKDSKESEPTTTVLLSDTVLAKKQGSWRDRIRDKRN